MVEKQRKTRSSAVKDFFSFITTGLEWWEIMVYATWIILTIALLISFVVG